MFELGLLNEAAYSVAGGGGALFQDIADSRHKYIVYENRYSSVAMLASNLR